MEPCEKWDTRPQSVYLDNLLIVPYMEWNRLEFTGVVYSSLTLRSPEAMLLKPWLRLNIIKIPILIS